MISLKHFIFQILHPVQLSLISLSLLTVLTGCGMRPSEVESERPVMARGVAQGVKVGLGAPEFNSLKQYGMMIADSREGVHVIIPLDDVFAEHVYGIQLSANETEGLDALADLLKEYSQVKFSVVGHTDDIMNPRSQAELSLRYAQSVADYLTAAGVRPSRLARIEGKSDREPVVEGDDPLSRSMNRRVEVIVRAPVR